MGALLPANVLHALPMSRQSMLLGHTFFPNLISPPFMIGLHGVFYLSAAMCFVAALASFLRGKRYIYQQESATLQRDTVAPGAESSVSAGSD